jgi:hypothetical protein
MSARIASVLIFTALITAAGCRQPAPVRRGYFGPTEPMADVIAQVNRNNTAIPTLRAAGDFEARIVEDNRSHFINGDVVLLYRRPEQVRVVATKDIAGRIFEAASNDERYWLIVKGETDTMWWGRVENLDEVDQSQLPIRPDLLMEVLGVDEINPDFLREPVPTMRFNNDADAYMITYNVRLPDRWAVQKEVWYDRQTKLPRSVLLFDENGRIVLRAYLSRHEPVEGATGGAQIATRYDLFFPDTGSTIRFDLQDVALTRNRAPNARSFTFPADPGVSRVINLDERARQ